MPVTGDWKGALWLQQHSVITFFGTPRSTPQCNGEGKTAQLCFLHVLVLEVGASIHQGEQCISLTPASEKLCGQNCIFSGIIPWCLQHNSALFISHLKQGSFLLTEVKTWKLQLSQLCFHRWSNVQDLPPPRNVKMTRQKGLQKLWADHQCCRLHLFKGICCTFVKIYQKDNVQLEQ